MPRAQLLSAAQREALLAIPVDRAGLIEHYILGEPDLAWIRQHRGVHNRLGVAVQLALLRYPGRVLRPEETPPGELLAFLAGQVNAPLDAWVRYAQRPETRREHQRELEAHLGLRAFSAAENRSLAECLAPLALQTDRGLALVSAALEELRRRRVILPRLAVIERLCAEVAVRGRRAIFRTLTHDLTADQRRMLDQLLQPRAERRPSHLHWLRAPPGAPNPRSLLAHIERLRHVRALGLPPDLGQAIHQNRLLRLARDGAVTPVQHLSRMDNERRHATLVAMALEASAVLTDETLDLHDRIVGKLFADAKRRHQTSFQESGQAINEKVRLYAEVGHALLAARRAGLDPFAAIEKVVSWDRFERSVEEAEQLARPDDFDFLGLLGEQHRVLRRYMPALLEAFEFRAAPAAMPVLDAIEKLRAISRTRARNLPPDVPIEFVSPRWKDHVLTDRGIDRRFYELCALTELKNRLRAGDIWVEGSHRYRDFEAYLLPRTRFEDLRAEGNLRLAVSSRPEEYLGPRLAELSAALEDVDRRAARGDLPDAAIVDGELKITPLKDAVPDEVDVLTRQSYALLPHVKVTDLLLEVDRWTGFTRHFTHSKSGAPCSERDLLLTAILADAINLGLSKMAEACPGVTARRLDWLAALHIRDETYTKALAELVNAQHRHPFAANWGEGTTSSSDGLRVRAAGQGEPAGTVNLRYGTEPGVLFYTHLSDQHMPFHTNVITTARDATHVIDGLLYHESDLAIEEHYTDTAGYTDHVFALCRLLGFRFAPRIRDLADKRLYVPDAARQFSALGPLVGGKLNTKVMQGGWAEILRLASSIRHGTVTASLIIRKLSSYPRQNSLAVALREMGRLERSIFHLEWMRDPELRRRVLVGLNKGEAENSLRRAVFFNKQGEIRDRTLENQRYRACGLNLVVAAIILWNTVYLDRAIKALRAHGIAVDPALLRHLSPIGWGHIALTGDYTWQSPRGLVRGRYRPLRPIGAPP